MTFLSRTDGNGHRVPVDHVARAHGLPARDGDAHRARSQLTEYLVDRPQRGLPQQIFRPVGLRNNAPGIVHPDKRTVGGIERVEHLPDRPFLPIQKISEIHIKFSSKIFGTPRTAQK